LDVLVPVAAVVANNPGNQPLDKESSEDTKVVLDTNAIELFVTIRESLGSMPQDGRVLVPSGSLAREPSSGMGNYVVSKAAAAAFATDVDQTVRVVDLGFVATEYIDEKGRGPTDVAGIFRWAALESPSKTIDGDIVGLREWKQSTR
jgi:NAD(P)-dependent dehydrogenase (short-subunit alcohol dehydrogenase family)